MTDYTPEEVERVKKLRENLKEPLDLSFLSDEKDIVSIGLRLQEVVNSLMDAFELPRILLSFVSHARKGGGEDGPPHTTPSL